MDRPALLAYRQFWNIADWVFPPDCVGCGKPGLRLCLECRNKIQYLDRDICPVCGYPKKGKKICTECIKISPKFTQMRSVAAYTNCISNALVALKYHNRLDVGIIFGEELAKVVNDNRWPVDVIVPIPLGKLHKQERGYNQAGVLARSTALQLNLPMDDKSIRRKRETFTQVKLSNEERRKNLVDAFEVTGHRLDGKRVLIVDDVITTGTTINSCAGAVISSGAKEVYALSLGRSIITNVSA